MSKRAESALACLSDKQLQVLALVAQHRVAKEIAWELQISEDTVAQRIKRVQTLLGVHSRAEAARVYLEAQQGRSVYNPSVYELSGLADRSGLSDQGPSLGSGVETSDTVDTLHQPQPAYAAGFVNWPTERPWYARLLETDRKNTLSSAARTLVIGIMTLLVILSVAAVVALAEGLSRIF
jgi:DNA-binding CsgD family transcriptional regulator